jgi:hypothetical protein
MTKNMAFDPLWTLATAAARAHNGLAYHPCCDVWTSKASNAIRNSHKQKLQWKNLLSTLDKAAEDKKQALLGKMTEEGWRIPVVLNQACVCQPAQIVPRQSTFKPFQLNLQPQDLQASFASQDFALTGPNSSPKQDPGRLYD